MRAPVPCTAAAVVRLLSTLLLLGATAANAQVAQQQVGAALGSSSDGAGELSRIRVDAESGFFRDSSGRARLFRGVNAVSKLPPFHPQPAGFDSAHSLSAVDAKNLREWGFNVVRLGVLWQATIPRPGYVNESYLDAIELVVSTLASEGIYTIIDAHQDCLGRRFCGEGLPDWAVMKALDLAGINASDPREAFPSPHRWDLHVDKLTGLPDLSRCQQHNFVEYYGTKLSLASWNALFRSDELWSDFAAHWQAIARRFAGNSAVLSYELLNEPWGRGSDAAELLPLYEHLHGAIRALDNETVVMYEPHVVRGQLGIATDFPSGAPGGRAYLDRQALSYHIYCFNNSRKILEPICDAALDLAWSAADRSRKVVGGGAMMTEFGAVGNDDVSISLLETVLDAAEKRLQSWAYWNFKSYDDITTAGSPASEGLYNPDGTVQTTKVRLLSRPFVYAVAGKPLKASFDNKRSVYSLEYVVTRQPANATPTEIFVNARAYYPRGYEVQLEPAGVNAWYENVADDENRILIKHGANTSGVSLGVRITPKLEE